MESEGKKKLLAQLKGHATALAKSDDVLDVSAFKAIIVSTGRGALLKKTPLCQNRKFRNCDAR